MKQAILCSPRLPTEIVAALSEHTDAPCLTIPPCNTLPEPTCDHPDMLFFNLTETAETVTEAEYYAVNPRFFGQFASPRLLLEERTLQSQYPFDILFDALSIGGTLYCRRLFTSSVISSRFERISDVRQGYAACSTLCLSDKAAITADPSISRALTADGIRVLKITPGGIRLPGYDSGFIGGASAVLGDTVFFFGSISDHPESQKIRDFCVSEGFTVTDFPDLPLTDYGSIRTLTFERLDHITP